MNARHWWMAGLLGSLIATAVADPAAGDVDWRWRVQPGDTLIALSEAWLEPPHGWRELQKLNRVADPLHLMPGSSLRMPLAWLKRQAAVADVQFAKGQVVRKRAGEPDTPLIAGAQLRSGDVVRTGEQSSLSQHAAPDPGWRGQPHPAQCAARAALRAEGAAGQPGRTRHRVPRPSG
jgi:hypothetical protein